MDVNLMGRLPPQSIEAEQSVIGSILLDKEVIPVITEVLRGEDFYRQDHREIFEAVMDLFDRGEPIDLITVSEQLRLRGSLDNVGGLEYLMNMANAVPTTANARHYAKIVEEKAILRKLIKASTDIVDMGFEASEEVSFVLDRAEKNIFDILQRRNLQGFAPIKDVLVETFNRLEELHNNKGFVTGIPTGFLDLDYKTAGLHNSDLILVAARPAMGKTSFALNIAQYAAVHSQVPVAVFSLEMSREQLVNRLLCGEAMVDSQRMRTGKLEDDDWKKIARALGPLSEAPIYIDDTSGISVTEIRAKCRRLKLEKNLGLVVIDYLQLMQGRGKTENRQQEISEISRSLKILAKEINVPVICLSQLSRAPESRTDHRPILSDLRESGAIEQDADIVIFLYRDDYYNPETEKKNIAEAIIAKHRSGSTGTVELVWLGQYTKFAMLVVSILLSLLLTLFIHGIVVDFLRTNLFKSISVFTIFSYFLGALLTIIFLLLGVIFNRVTKERGHISELRNFKDYTDALHRVSTEVEVYELLFRFICNTPSVDQITLYYRSDKPSENAVWQKITNCRDSSIPLCKMSPKNCPLIKLGRECIVESIENDITCTYQATKYRSGSYICLPIADMGYPQSILQIYSKYEGYFDSTSISNVRSYIEIAKLVISGRRTLYHLNQKASTDKLTKLYNRGFLEPYLENQIEAANLSKQQLSVIMVDIDHFKNVNDTFGHHAGDQVLVIFSEVVLNCVRKTDLVARYGGEEFLVILPSTDTETTRTIAERIRQTVATTRIPPIDGKNIPTITCSLGISTYPVHCSCKDTLIKTSDIALYKAKQSGRNCTKVYDKEMETDIPETLLHREK